MEEESKDNRMATGTFHEMQSILRTSLVRSVHIDATPPRYGDGLERGSDRHWRDVFSFWDPFQELSIPIP